MPSVLSTMVSLTPELATESWKSLWRDPAHDPRHPSTHRARAIFNHYAQVISIDAPVFTQRLVRSMNALEATEQLESDAIAIPFDMVYRAWEKIFERNHGQQITAERVAKTMWAATFNHTVLRELEQATEEERLLMKDILWTMLHRSLGLE